VTAPARLTATECVYVLGVEGGPCKVGRSVEPEERARQLQIKYGSRFILLGVSRMAQVKAISAERYAHWLLRDRHLSGEWFDATREEALAAVNKALTDEMDPEYVLPSLDEIALSDGMAERIETRFPRGTRERLRKVLGSTGHAQFIRDAIEEKLAREEATQRATPDAE
jgi:hypothetical protein